MENRVSEIKIVSNQFIKEKEYWVGQLKGDLGKSHFPYDFQTPQGERRSLSMDFTFGDEISGKLLKISSGSEAKLHMMLLTGVAILLQKMTNTQDLIINTTIDRQEVEGQFINTVLPILSQIKPELSFKELLLQIRDVVVGAIEHQNYPLEAMLTDLGFAHTDQEFPLSDLAVIWRDLHSKEYLALVQPNLIFEFRQEQGRVACLLEYNCQRYQAQTVERLIEYLKRLFAELLMDVDLPVGQMELLTVEEKRLVMDEYNQTAVDEPREKLIQELFEEQVAQDGERVALFFDGAEMTYGELNGRANQLARRLQAEGVGINSIVGLCVTRSPEMIVGILGVLKAGAGYLPIDPSNPRERNEFILQDSGAQVLLTTCGLADELEYEVEQQVLYLDDDRLYQGEMTNLPQMAKPSDLAYLIYTSGTTGFPKGVMIPQMGLVNYICWARERYVGEEQVNFPLYTSFAFDLTVTSIFTPLVTGNGIVIFKEDHEVLIEKVIRDHRVGVVKLTPSHLKLLRYQQFHDSRVGRLILGGENLERELAQEILENFQGQVEIFNEYGPTEAVVGCMIHHYQPEQDLGQFVPIGKPIDNAQIYLLDDQLQPVAVGAVGELYVAGAGLALGYLNQPELTAERFIPNPFLPGQLMYKTGDRAKRISPTCIEFIGRLDEQMNLKGFRIEPGEIVARLKEHPEIQDAVVLLKDDKLGDQSLYACLVSEAEVDLQEVKAHLMEALPKYMMPAHFVQVAELPLTVNGKVDQRKLLELADRLKVQVEYVAPRNEVEEKLQKIWSSILEVEMIGVKDDFFNIGGDSIKSISLLNKINTEFNTRYELVDIYERGTIEKFALRIMEEQDSTAQDELEKVRQQVEAFKMSFLEPDTDAEELE